MIRAALCIAGKDLTLVCRRGAALPQSFLLGLLLIFIFSLSGAPGEQVSAQAAAAVFWLSALFCQVLIFNALYALEEDDGQRDLLLLLPCPAQSVWLGKALAGLLLLLAAQAVFAPALVLFLDQSLEGSAAEGLLLLLLADLGLAALGSLLGALAQGQASRESLLSIIIFPLLLPLLLAAIRIGAGVLSGRGEGAAEWFRVLIAFDAVFAAAGLVLFGALYGARE